MRFPGRRMNTPDLSLQTVPVFAPDARGAALFHAVTDRNVGTLNSAVRIDARGPSWGGWTQAPQVVRGAGVGSGRPVVEAGATIDQERGLTASPVQQIFEQRMASRRLG